MNICQCGCGQEVFPNQRGKIPQRKTGHRRKVTEAEKVKLSIQAKKRWEKLPIADKKRAAAEFDRRVHNKAVKEKIKQLPSQKKGPDHHAGIWWRLRDPSNRVWEFRNLSEFIRQHPELFDPDDVVPRYSRGGCRAASGIIQIRPFNREGKLRATVAGSWKGWTWRGGADLLNRRYADTELAMEISGLISPQPTIH